MSPSGVRRRVTRRRYFPRREIGKAPGGGHRATHGLLARAGHPRELGEDGKGGHAPGVPLAGRLENGNGESARPWRGGVSSVGPYVERCARDADRDAAVEGERREDDEEEARGGAQKRASHAGVLSRSMPHPGVLRGRRPTLRSTPSKGDRMAGSVGVLVLSGLGPAQGSAGQVALLVPLRRRHSVFGQREAADPCPSAGPNARSFHGRPPPRPQPPEVDPRDRAHESRRDDDGARPRLRPPGRDADDPRPRRVEFPRRRAGRSRRREAPVFQGVVEKEVLVESILTNEAGDVVAKGRAVWLVGPVKP